MRILIICFLVTMLSGCGGTTLYLIKDTDIILLEKGQTITAPDEGAYISSFYLKEVMESKIQ